MFAVGDSLSTAAAAWAIRAAVPVQGTCVSKTKTTFRKGRRTRHRDPCCGRSTPWAI